MPYDNDKEFQRNDVYSKRIRAGKRRTYFFDVRTTKANDYYLTITESKKRFHDDGYDRHKVFIYKEDFNKFINTLEEVVDHIKQNLMPDYDFDTFNRDPEDITYDNQNEDSENVIADAVDVIEETIAEVESESTPTGTDTTDSGLSSEEEEVIKWD